MRRLLDMVGLEMGDVHGLRGKNLLDQRLRGYNNAARFAPWVVVRDLNRDAPCASALVQQLLPTPAPGMCLRIAVRSAEAWLLADREEISRFLSVSPARVPVAPDMALDPKRLLVDLARRSRRRAIREDVVPPPGTSGVVGPGYSGRIIEFASKSWRPHVAARQSRSLSRSIQALRRWRRERTPGNS